MTSPCPTCGTINAPQASVCAQCWTPLEAPIENPTGIFAHAPAPGSAPSNAPAFPPFSPPDGAIRPTNPGVGLEGDGRMTFLGAGGGLYLALLGGVVPLLVMLGVGLGAADALEELANGEVWGDIAALAMLVVIAPGVAVAAVLGGHRVQAYYWPEVTLDGRRCIYEGTPWRLMVAMFGHTLLLVCTLGFSAPWFVARYYRWVASQVDLEGERMTFDGTGGQIFGVWIVCLLFGWIPVIGPVGVGLWAHGRLAAWRWRHTTLAGRPMAFDFDLGDLLGAMAVPAMLSFCTLGIYAPWVLARCWAWEARQLR